ncbi:nitroreductase family protein [Anoxynatronum sibiricum]|uniref:Nitroreductase family protein n=1 Tax=Anoxynatronum sibiricum TaxID=210623 RepID=A0ABU9VX08_9CLOT
MNETTLFETIAKRKSVRKYNMNPLPENLQQQIRDAAGELCPLNPDIKTDIHFLSEGAVKGLLTIKAPHYLLFFSEESPESLLNAGFMLQQMDLYLSSLELGTCWLGMAKPNKAFATVSPLPFVIALSVGTATEPVHRQHQTDFQRKPLPDMVTGSDHEALVESARLAPSATNSQPWQFQTTPDAIRVFRMKPGVMKAWLYDRLNQVDMGIVLCHLWLAAKAAAYQPSLLNEAGVDVPEGQLYVKTLKLEAVDPPVVNV